MVELLRLNLPTITVVEHNRREEKIAILTCGQQK